MWISLVMVPFVLFLLTNLIGGWTAQWVCLSQLSVMDQPCSQRLFELSSFMCEMIQSSLPDCPSGFVRFLLMNLIVWLLLDAIVHVSVKLHSICCDNLTEQSDIQVQSIVIESFDFTWPEVEIEDVIHDVSIVLPLRFNGARIVNVDGQGM